MLLPGIIQNPTRTRWTKRKGAPNNDQTGAAPQQALGRVAERSIAAVLKTADGQPSVGSNPTPSAITQHITEFNIL